MSRSWNGTEKLVKVSYLLESKVQEGGSWQKIVVIDFAFSLSDIG